MDKALEPIDSALTPRAVAILEMIAKGHSYEQIIQTYPNISYTDIFRAANEALVLGQSVSRSRQARKAAKASGPSARDRARAKYPRSYDKWHPAEEDDLRRLLSEGYTVARIATYLQRQRSAIRSRINRLGLADHLSEKERARFDRMIQQDLEDPDNR